MKIDDEGLWDRHPHALVSGHGEGEDDGELDQVGSAASFLAELVSFLGLFYLGEPLLMV